MVGEPGKRRCCACSTVSISVSLTLMAKPSSTATVSRRPRTSLRWGQPRAYRISTATACRLPGVVVPSLPEVYPDSRPRVDGAKLMSDSASVGSAAQAELEPAGNDARVVRRPEEIG